MDQTTRGYNYLEKKEKNKGSSNSQKSEAARNYGAVFFFLEQVLTRKNQFLAKVDFTAFLNQPT